MSVQTKEYGLEWRRKNRTKWNGYSRAYYAKAKERIRIKRQSPEYRAKLSAYLKEWRATHVEERRAAIREWMDRNPEWLKEYRAAYGPRRRELYRQRRDAVCARKRELARTRSYRDRVNNYQRKRRTEDIEFCIIGRLRASMNRALRRQFVRKSKRTVEQFGCTPTELRAHIESLFLPGMSWANRHLWHIDHKRPLASFDLTDPIQQRLAFHYTNLQPLWAHDNQSKGAKFAA